jgi:hypothetical protein
MGLRGIWTGELEVSKDRWSGEYVRVTFAGDRARWMGVALTTFGTSILMLLVLAPRALDARLKRSSLFALPRWQRILLIFALLMLAVSILGLVAGSWRA